MTTKRSTVGLSYAGIVACVLGLPLGLVSCDKSTETQKTTTTRTTDTPEGTKKTTEKTERKVETEPKNPR